MKGITRDQLLLAGAFAAVYLVWGSTYLVNYIAIQEIPPFLMSGMRFCLAGSLLLGLTLLQGKPWPTPEQWKYGAITGVLFLAAGTGLVVWAEQYIDTGLAALFVAFEPLIIVLMVWMRRAQRPGWNSILGVAVGVAGMVLLVGQPRFHNDPQTWMGIGAILVAILSWGFASLYVTEVNLPASRMQTASLQMLGGGAVLLIAGFAAGEHRGFSLLQVSEKGWFAFAYLIVLGSWLAFSAFNYLLVKVSPEKVATTNYVNPVVALFLGWALNGEDLTYQSILAAILLLGGVFFINSRFVRGRAVKLPLFSRKKSDTI
jgi:drug/metabolite transporter (DMT)-like permease